MSLDLYFKINIRRKTQKKPKTAWEERGRGERKVYFITLEVMTSRTFTASHSDGERSDTE